LSAEDGNIEHMFGYLLASQSTPESAALLDRVREAGRAEARAAADRLVAVGELFVLRCRDSGEQQDWAADAWEAVAAQVAAAVQCSVAMGHSYLRYAVAMRDRLPEVGKAFQAGDIDYRAFQTIVFRTDLITDPDMLAKVDARLAVLVSRRPSLTRGGLAAAVDRVVAMVDRDALRRAAKAAEDRYVDVVPDSSGMAWMEGKLFAPTGEALDRRLDELAGSVCEGDPRTLRQRRADALGALAAGAERLVCGCGSADCPVTGAPAPTSNVVIHVVADRAAVEGTGTNPGILPWVEGLIPAELIAELAKSARLVPLSIPAGAPEPGYTPSAKLAEFVRCRDLTCRAPGCDRPAVQCDVDHTIPYADGGATHASNLKCLCRLHHLMKTFWKWRDQQLPDGTVVWRLPDGHAYVTTPGSALLFPSLCAPTGDPPTCDAKTERCGERTAMMPLRTRTRAQNRAARIATERHHNRNARLAAQPAQTGPPPVEDDEPPPF
jgi:Domain of unknown function (DUF222)/HNH endonuclease